MGNFIPERKDILTVSFWTGGVNDYSSRDIFPRFELNPGRLTINFSRLTVGVRRLTVDVRKRTVGCLQIHCGCQKTYLECHYFHRVLSEH